MKYPLWGVILFIIVILLLVLRTIHIRDLIYEGFTSEGFDETSHPSEGFASEEVEQADKCPNYRSCDTCTNASGCAWCPDTKKCVNNNQACINTSEGARGGDAPPQSIFTSMHCESNQPTIIEPEFTLHKNMIADKPKPPNVGLAYAI